MMAICFRPIGTLVGYLALSIGSQASLVNGDFSTDSLARGNFNYVPGLDGGWVAKNAFDGDDGTVDNWQIIDGAVQQLSNSGSATRVAQAISAGDLTGTGWTLDFDLIDDGISRVQLWGGVDDMTNNDSQRLIATGSDNAPAGGIVEDPPGWVLLLEERDLEEGTKSLEIPSDLSDYDILMLRFRGNGGTVGVRIDNVALVSPDPPAPLAVTNVSLDFDAEPPTVTLTWNSQEGTVYAVDASSDLGTAAGWPEMEDSIQGQPGQTTETLSILPEHLGLPELFFRVRIQEGADQP